jgi:hypothetical protein
MMQAAKSGLSIRHCEERSDEAIQGSIPGASGLLRFARNGEERPFVSLSAFAVRS